MLSSHVIYMLRGSPGILHGHSLSPCGHTTESAQRSKQSSQNIPSADCLQRPKLSPASFAWSVCLMSMNSVHLLSPCPSGSVNGVFTHVEVYTPALSADFSQTYSKVPEKRIIFYQSCYQCINRQGKIIQHTFLAMTATKYLYAMISQVG